MKYSLFFDSNNSNLKSKYNLHLKEFRRKNPKNMEITEKKRKLSSFNITIKQTGPTV